MVFPTCIDTIADEDKGTGAFWVSASVTGKDFPVVLAERVKVVDGKFAAQHITFDTYHFLSHDGSVALAADFTTASYFTTASGMVIGASAVGIVVGAVVGVIVSFVMKKKQHVLLDEQF